MESTPGNAFWNAVPVILPDSRLNGRLQPGVLFNFLPAQVYRMMRFERFHVSIHPAASTLLTQR
jgi:hypothetical protein